MECLLFSYIQHARTSFLRAYIRVPLRFSHSKSFDSELLPPQQQQQKQRIHCVTHLHCLTGDGHEAYRILRSCAILCIPEHPQHSKSPTSTLLCACIMGKYHLFPRPILTLNPSRARYTGRTPITDGVSQARGIPTTQPRFFSASLPQGRPLDLVHTSER